jgi:hypothetical protein
VYMVPTIVMYLLLSLLPTATDWFSVGYRVVTGAMIWALMGVLVLKEVRMVVLRHLLRG